MSDAVSAGPCRLPVRLLVPRPPSVQRPLDPDPRHHGPAAKVRAAVEADNAKLESLGYSVTSLYVDDGKTAEATLTKALANGGYDCIMIGAGLRIVPPYFLLFEKLIDIIHRHAPASTKLCFNTNPTDTADAVQRWV
jgi:hypothetical protein